MDTEVVLDLLRTIWAGKFTLDRDPRELCPLCLEKGDLVWMKSYKRTASIIGGFAFWYECKACDFRPTEPIHNK